MTLVHGQSELPVVSESGRVPEPAALTASQYYGHDAAGRLKTWTLDGATTTYTSDAAGNLTGIDRPGTGDDTTFTPGDDNQLASAVTAGVTTTYDYDDFGRRTHESSSAGETTFTWDSLGRLTGIASEDATSTYEYGPTGMREEAVVVSAEATTTTECVWQGGSLAASRVTDTRETRDGVTTTVTDYRYLYGPSGLPLELIVTPLGGTPVSYTYQCDREGSVVALTDATGAAVATYAYDPWGALLEAPEDGIGARNPLRYRGYYFDDATGLYYLPARHYDPATARFLSPDPAAPSAGDPLSLNRYAYCVGDPVNADDPTGAVTDVAAEAWGTYYARFSEGGSQSIRREAAEQAARQSRGGGRRPGGAVIIWNTVMSTEVAGLNISEMAAFSMAANSGGDAYVYSGRTQDEWEYALGGAPIGSLTYVGHGPDHGLRLVDGKYLNLSKLPTASMIGASSITLVCCNGMDGFAGRMERHFGVDVTANR